MLQRSDEALQTNFSVELDFAVVGIFQSVDGLSAQMETEDFFEGGINTYKHQLPGPISYGPITLTTGMLNGRELWMWVEKIVWGAPIIRRNISIVMRQGKRDSIMGDEIMRWNLMMAYPTQWEGPSFNAGSTEVAVQRLTLVHSGIFTSGSAL
jgi:phage tail-like protein